ncbi:MAG: hypothetical protein ACI9KE_006722 [Polyangiales bacterium]|jgi:hypothetical protein
MQHAVDHQLDIPTARLAAEKAFTVYSVEYAEFKPTANWTTDTHCDVTFTVKKVTLEGTMDLVPGKVLMDLDVPLLFRPFKKLALGYVEKEIRVWLDKAARGELDESASSKPE